MTWSKLLTMSCFGDIDPYLQQAKASKRRRQARQQVLHRSDVGGTNGSRQQLHQRAIGRAADLSVLDRPCFIKLVCDTKGEMGA